jgi:hypothetical protein
LQKRFFRDEKTAVCEAYCSEGRYENYSSLQRKISLPLVLLAALIPSGCTDVSDEIKVKIIANGSDFSGYYINGADITNFSSDAVSGSVYSREIVFSSLSSGDEVEFDVSTTDDAYSLTIVVYRNDEKVKSGSSTSSAASSPLYLNLTYTVGEENSSSGSGSSSSS